MFIYKNNACDTKPYKSMKYELKKAFKAKEAGQKNCSDKTKLLMNETREEVAEKGRNGNAACITQMMRIPHAHMKC